MVRYFFYIVIHIYSNTYGNTCSTLYGTHIVPQFFGIFFYKYLCCKLPLVMKFDELKCVLSIIFTYGNT